MRRTYPVRSPVRTVLAAALGGALIALWLLLAVTEVVASAEWSYAYSLSSPQVAADAGLNREQVRVLLMRVIGYARGTGTAALQVPLPAGHPRAGEPAFTQREIDHMADVRDLFTRGRAVRRAMLGLLAGGAALTFLTPLAMGRRRTAGAPGSASGGHDRIAAAADLWARAFTWAAGWGAVVLGLAALALTVGFSIAFDWFHLLLFRNDLWQLPPDSMLIALLPVEQFQRLAVLIGTGFVLGLAVAAVLGRALRRRAAH